MSRYNSCNLTEIVEIDEGFFGKRRYGRQRCIVGAIERHPTGDKRRIKLAIYARPRVFNLRIFHVAKVSSGAHVTTDCLWLYNEIELLDYKHEFCNRSQYHFGPTNLIEGLRSSIKRHIKKVHSTPSFSTEELSNILKEYENRHNTPEIFYTVDDCLKECACSALLQ